MLQWEFGVFNNLSRKIGFTTTEIKILLFFISVFLVGLAYKTYLLEKNTSEIKNFDYSSEEKLFQQENGQDSTFEKDKNVDYKQEVLDFNGRNFNKKEAKKLPGKKSININTAGLKDLVTLPGIGTKTAEKIIELRRNKGSFKKLNELLEVKGIGKIKLNNIESFLYIEHSNIFKAPEEK